MTIILLFKLPYIYFFFKNRIFKDNIELSYIIQKQIYFITFIVLIYSYFIVKIVSQAFST